MKARWLVRVSLLMGSLVALGCAPTKVPGTESPPEYRQLRIEGGSIGGESSTAAMSYASFFNKYYPDIEWSSASGGSTANVIYLSKGTIKLSLHQPSHYISAYGLDKVPESRIRSINLPRGPTHYVFLIPEDKPWKDITQVPKGTNLSPGPPGTTLPPAAEIWLSLAGLSKKDFNWIPLGQQEMADAYRNGKIDLGFLTVSGMPPAIMDMYTSPRKIKAMGLSPEQAAKAKAEAAFEGMGWEVAQGTLTKMVPDIFKYDVVCPLGSSFLCSRDDFAEGVAYKMAKILDEHYDDFVQIYPAVRFGGTPQWLIQRARPPFSIHSGVAKYYREKGYLK